MDPCDCSVVFVAWGRVFTTKIHQGIPGERARFPRVGVESPDVHTESVVVVIAVVIFTGDNLEAEVGLRFATVILCIPLPKSESELEAMESLRLAAIPRVVPGKYTVAEVLVLALALTLALILALVVAECTCSRTTFSTAIPTASTAALIAATKQANPFASLLGRLPMVAVTEAPALAPAKAATVAITNAVHAASTLPLLYIVTAVEIEASVAASTRTALSVPHPAAGLSDSDSDSTSV
jgi:hypothetical protein